MPLHERVCGQSSLKTLQFKICINISIITTGKALQTKTRPRLLDSLSLELPLLLGPEQSLS